MASGHWRPLFVAIVIICHLLVSEALVQKKKPSKIKPGDEEITGGLGLPYDAAMKREEVGEEVEENALDEEKRFKLSFGGGSLKASLGGSASIGGSAKISAGGAAGIAAGGSAGVSVGGGAGISVGGGASVSAGGSASIGGKAGITINGGAKTTDGSGTEAPLPGTEAPVPATEAPVPATEAPVPATEAPVQETEAPVPATEAPLPATEAPVPATEAPVPATETPVPATEAPVPATEAPVPATEAPVPATEAPVPVTEAPVPATEATVPATEAPVPATEAPVPATDAPLPATKAPVPATEAPVPATEAPVPATEAPLPVTGAPVPATEAPVPATEAPVPETPAPGTAAPQPVTSAPRPVSVGPTQIVTSEPVLPTEIPACTTSSKVISSDNICEIWDINNVKTSDGLQFFIPSTSLVGSTLLLSHDSNNDAFSIQVKILSEQSLEIYLYEDGVLKLVLRSRNNKLVTELKISGFEIVHKAGHVLIASDTGYELIWDLKMYVGLEVTNIDIKVDGLCGNNNGVAEDDGNVVNKLPALIKHFKKGNCSYCLPSGTDNDVCKKILRDGKTGLGACNNLLDDSLFLKACTEGLCRNGIDSACSTAEIYSKICQRLGGKPSTPPACPKPSCKTTGAQYDTCKGACMPTCQAPSSLCSSTSSLDKCLGGCICPNGLVEDKYRKKCVKISECMCEWVNKNNKVMAHKPGSVVMDGCKKCTCSNGKFECTEEHCEAECSASGDPHFHTFDGKKYDFMGECEYYLVKSADYQITITNHHCNKLVNGVQPTCVKSVKIIFNGTVVSLEQGKKISQDGKEIQLGLKHHPTPQNLVFSKASSLFVRVTLLVDGKVIVEWDGVNRVHVIVNGKSKGKVEGLCGTYDDDKTNDFKTPEGDIETTASKFGDKWQVESETVCPKAPEPGKPCDNDDEKLQSSQKACSIIKLPDGPFKACHKLIDPESFFQDCVFDMCSCSDDTERCLCPNIGEYATNCEIQGVKLPKDWRNNELLNGHCQIKCPEGMEFQECADVCKYSCEDLGSSKICPQKCVPGCACPKGQAVDNNGKCVTINKCPCIIGEKVILPNQHIKEDEKEMVCIAGVLKPVIKPTMAPPTVGACGENEQWVQCIESLCHNKCGKKTNVCPKSKQCTPGCACKQGFLKDKHQVCVLPTACKCNHGGKDYSHDDVVELRCSKMTCIEGHWNVEKKECTGLCTAYGESHFQTFDQKWYQFQGNCSYVLSRSKPDAPHKFQVKIMNQVCGTSGVVCQKAVEVQYELQGVTNTIILAHGKAKMLKGAAFGVNQVGLYIYITTPIGMSLLWNKGTLIYLKLPHHFMGKIEGLCGNFNEKETDEFLGPAGGKPYYSATAFGDSWKANQKCKESVAVKNTCNLPEKKHFAIQRCSVIMTKAFSECHAVIDPKPFLDKCVYDTCGCDLGGECECTCTAIQAYSEACNMVGIHVKWRTQEICPIQCECPKPGSDFCPCYSACVSVCPPKTCKNRDNYANILIQCRLNNEDICVEGCTKKPCPPGYVLEDGSSTAKCIPEKDCHVCPDVVEPECGVGEKIVVTKDKHDCIHKNCSCEPSLCPKPLLECLNDKKLVQVNIGTCCPVYECQCPKPSECKNETKPVLTGAENDGLVAIRDKKFCCDKWIVKCGKPLRCKGNPICKSYEKEEIEVHGKCCNKTKCTCYPSLCPPTVKPECEKIDEIHDIVDPLACCKEWVCRCPPKEQCPEPTKPTDLEIGEEIVMDKSRCCPFYVKKCSNKCPADPVCKLYESLEVAKTTKCCNITTCVCDKEKCPVVEKPKCQFDQVLIPVDDTACCVSYHCVCDKTKCTDEERPTDLAEGETAIIDKNYCCQKWNKVCGPAELCPAPPKCKSEERLNVVYEGKCCNKTACECYPSLCPESPMPECHEDERVIIKDPKACCKEFACQCKPLEECKEPNAGDLEEGEVSILDDSGCCPKLLIQCLNETCTPVPECAPYEDLLLRPLGSRHCCMGGTCKCNTKKCKPKPIPKCSKHDESLVVVDEDACCKEHECRCPPDEACPVTSKPTDLSDGQVAIRDPDFCCEKWIVVCKEETCKPHPECASHEILKVIEKGPCCNITSCECFPAACPKVELPECSFDQVPQVVDPNACCKTYKCACPDKSKCEPDTTVCKNEGEHAVLDENYCCPKTDCECVPQSCPKPPACSAYERLEVVHEGKCCNLTKCGCYVQGCPKVEIPECPFDKVPIVVDPKACCKTYKCACPTTCPNVTEPTDLEIGQIAVLDRDYCCPKYKIICKGPEACPKPPVCESFEELHVVHEGTCCNKSVCSCFPKKCPVVPLPKCIGDRERTVVDESACCKEYKCICPENCTHEKQPTDDELDYGEVAVKDPSYCCDKWVKTCIDPDLCAKPPVCKSFESITVFPGKCCNRSICACVKEKCPKKPDIKCDGDKNLVIKDPSACCPEFECKCPPSCEGKNEPMPTNLQPGQFAVKDLKYCCDKWIIKCEREICPADPVCEKHEQLQVIHEGACCNMTSCKCFPPGCPAESKVMPECEFDKQVQIVNPDDCCKRYKCACPDKCQDEEKPSGLEIGQCTVLDERYCCQKWNVKCCECPPNKKCPAGHQEEVIFEGKCCNQTTCKCVPEMCPEESKNPPSCGPDMVAVAVDPKACCKVWTCKCIPDKCPPVKIESNLDVGQIQVQCPEYTCCEKKCTICSGTCPPPPVCASHEVLKTIREGPCCNDSVCECFPAKCKPNKLPVCKKDKVVQIIDETACCKNYHCVCPEDKDCEHEPKPTDLEEGEIVEKDESFCCDKWIRKCNKTACEKPICNSHERPVVVHEGRCCPKISCECYPKLCPNITVPECEFDQIAVIANPDECCKEYKCKCPPKCKAVAKPTNLQPGQIAVKDENYCCDEWNVVCSGKCEPNPICAENEQLEVVLVGPCCNKSSCRCYPELCPPNPPPTCKFDQVLHVVDEKACCKEYECRCPPAESCLNEKEEDHDLEVGQCLEKNKDYCCTKYEKKCCEDTCPEPPKCTGEFEKPQIVRNGTCCVEYACECFPSLCPIVTPPTCRHDEILLIRNYSVCCKDYECECPPSCEDREKPSNLRPGQIAINKKSLGWCCDDWVIECEKDDGKNKCPKKPVCTDQGMVSEVFDEGPCCSLSKCSCNPTTCPKTPLPECQFDKVVIRSNSEDECCPTYSCSCPKNCSHELKPSDDLLEVGQVWVKDERYCCDNWIRQCIGSCPADPVCKQHEKLEVVQTGTCCNKTSCHCYPEQCKDQPIPECGPFEKMIVVDPSACCKTYNCECISPAKCPNITKPTDLEVGETIEIVEGRCCNVQKRTCSGKCPAEKVCAKGHRPVVTHEGKCCNETSCQCFPEHCPPESKTPPTCPFDKVVHVIDEDACCKEYKCVCPPSCVDEPKPTNLELGQVAVRDERYCCIKWKLACSTCPLEPTCKVGEHVDVVRNGTCCPEFKCGCYINECPDTEDPICTRKDEKLVVVDKNACCKTFKCVCPSTPECPIVTPPVPVFPGEIAVPDLNYCCDRKILTCDKKLCPPLIKSCAKNQVIEKIDLGILKCCPLHKCSCKPKSECQVFNLTCNYGLEKSNIPDDPNGCCEKPICKCPISCEGRNEPKPEGLQPGFIAVKDENYCCDKWNVVCKKELCKADPVCESWQQLEVVSEPGLCCPIKHCTCLPSKCPKVPLPICRKHEVPTMVDPDACCKSFRCECIPPENCTKTEAPDNLDVGEVPILDNKGCCPEWYKICRHELCPEPPKCKEHERAKIIRNGTCCPIYICECFKDLCPVIEPPTCSIIGQRPVIKDPKACCTEFKCACPPQCPPINKVDEGKLETGEIVVKITDGRCCPENKVTCSGKCPPNPTCRDDQRLEVSHIGNCCNKTKCVCDVCPPIEVPSCPKFDMVTKVIDPKACCHEFECVCPPERNCTHEQKPTDLETGEVAVKDNQFCCKKYKKICSGKCPADPKCKEPGMTLQTVSKGKCCDLKKCTCLKKLCPKVPDPVCQYDKQLVDVDPTACCVTKMCKCPTNCSELNEPKPEVLQEGQIAVRDEKFCCDRWKIICGGKCTKDPVCKPYESPKVVIEGPCCTTKVCSCEPSKCPVEPNPECRDDQKLVVTNPAACCKTYQCKCKVPKENCTKPVIPNDLRPGQVAKIDKSMCCDKLILTCDIAQCPNSPVCKDYERMETIKDICCNDSKCICDTCPTPPEPNCELPDMKVKAVKLNKCCSGLECYCDECNKECKPGFKYFEPNVNENGKKVSCCGECKPVVCFEVEKTKIAPKPRQPGEKWHKSNDPCTTYECVLNEEGIAEIETVVTTCMGCKLGEKNVIPEGECCGTCVKTECVYEGNVTIKVGESIIHDSCCNFTCVLDEETGLPVEREACVTCKDECDPGFEFVPPHHKQCCGQCVQTHCIVNGKELEVGQSIPAPNAKCFNIVCEKSTTDSGKPAFTVKKFPKYGICPPTPCENECLEPDPNTEECCQRCKAHCHPSNKTCSPKNIFAVNEQSKHFIKIIRNGKVCENKNVLPDLKECAGLCPSLTYVDGTEEGNKQTGRCSCCAPEKTKPRKILLTCNDLSVVPYTYHEPSTCKCHQSSCEKGNKPSSSVKRSEESMIDAMKDLLEKMEN